MSLHHEYTEILEFTEKGVKFYTGAVQLGMGWMRDVYTWDGEQWTFQTGKRGRGKASKKLINWILAEKLGL